MSQKPTQRKPRFSPEEIAEIQRNPPAILDVPTLAIFLNQSERKTRDDLRFGRIPSLRLGGRVLTRREDLERALAALVNR